MISECKKSVQTSKPNFAGRAQWVNLSLVLVLAVFVAACGGRKSVVTQDDSADYRGARTLPPLKKPGRELEQNNSPSVAAPAPAQQQTIAAQPIQAAQSTENEAASRVPEQAAGPASARVIDDKNSGAQLLIDAEFDSAWDFMRNNLNKSDITVHSRNKVAGRILIGCSSIEAGENVTVSKKGGWSIFKRGKKEELEHCALQLVGGKNKTTVNVLNRSGEMVPASAAKQIFSRLLNN